MSMSIGASNSTEIGTKMNKKEPNPGHSKSPAASSSSSPQKQSSSSTSSIVKAEPKIIQQGDKVIKSYVDETTGKIAAYEIGLKLEVSDFSGKWYPAKVVEVDSGESEVLVHFENWSSRFDEWIKMDSNRLRPSSNTNVVKTQYKVGEEVEAIWNVDGKRYPGVIQTVLPNDNYQVLFYDGIKYKKKYNQIFKVDPASKNVPPASASNETEPDTGPIQNPSTTRTKLGKKALRSLPELTPISQLQAQSSTRGNGTPVISSPPILTPANSKRRQQKVVQTPEEPKVVPSPPATTSSEPEPQLGKRRRTIHDYSALLKTTTRSTSFESTSSPKSPQSASSTPTPTRKKPGPKKKVVEILVDKVPEYDISFNDNSFELIPPKLEEQLPTPRRRGKKTPDVQTPAEEDDDESLPPAIDVIIPPPPPEEEPVQTLMKRPRKATEKALALLQAEAHETLVRRRTSASTASRRSLGQRRRWAAIHRPSPPKLTPSEDVQEETLPKIPNVSPEVIKPKEVVTPKPQKEEFVVEAPVSAPAATQPAERTTDPNVRNKRRRTFDDELIAAAATAAPRTDEIPGTSTTPDDATAPTKRKRTVTDYSMLLKTRPKFFFDIEEEEQRPNRLSRPKRNRQGTVSRESKEPVKPTEIVKVPSPRARASTPTTEIVLPSCAPIVVEQSTPVVTAVEEPATETDTPGKRSLRRSSSILRRGTSISEKEHSGSGIEVSPVISHPAPQPSDNDSLSTITTRRKSFARTTSISLTDETCNVTTFTVSAKDTQKVDQEVKTDKSSTNKEGSEISYPSVTLVAKQSVPKISKPVPGLLPLRTTLPFKKKSRFTSHKWWKKKSSRNKDKPSSRSFENGDSSMTFRKQTPSSPNGRHSSRTARKHILRRGDILTGLSSGRIKNIRDTIYQDGFKKYVLGVPAFKEVSVDIINCYCGLTEEHGLMIQCELCQCWQHGNCYEIETVKDMPVNYVCESCTSPEEVRASMEVDWSYDFHKTGKMPKLTGSKNLEPSKTKAIQESNELMERLYQVQEIVRSTRINLNILNSQPDHPKLYQWDKPHVTIKEENHQRKFNKLYKPLLRRLIYYHKDDPTYIERLRKKVEAAVNQRNTELDTKIQKQFYESNTFLSQKKKLSESSATSVLLLPPPPMLPALSTEKPGTSHALVREERAKKLKQQEMKRLESSLGLSFPSKASKLPKPTVTPTVDPPLSEISSLVSDMLAKVEVEATFKLVDPDELSPAHSPKLVGVSEEPKAFCKATSKCKDSETETLVPSKDSETETLVPSKDSETETLVPSKDSETETLVPSKDSETETTVPVEVSSTILVQVEPRPPSTVETKSSPHNLQETKIEPQTKQSTQEEPKSESLELSEQQHEAIQSQATEKETQQKLSEILDSVSILPELGPTLVTAVKSKAEEIEAIALDLEGNSFAAPVLEPAPPTEELSTTIQVEKTAGLDNAIKEPVVPINTQQQPLDSIVESLVPIVVDTPTAPKPTSDVMDINTNPEILMEMDPSDPKFTSIAADLVKSCCEEPEGLIKTLEDLAQNSVVSTACTANETGILAGSEQETDLAMTEDGIGTESDLLTFLDEVFVGNLDAGFVPTPGSSTTNAASTTDSNRSSRSNSKPVEQAPASTGVGSSAPTSGPITLTRITPELCRENLTLTIRDQQRMIDEYLDEIEVKVTELERQRYGNPFAFQQQKHIDRLNRKIRGLLKNLELLKTLEIKADTQLRIDRRYDPDTTDESTQSDENDYE